MTTSYVLLSLLGIFSFVIAVPTKETKRTVGAVQVCTGVNFTGSCWYGTMPINTCIDLNGYAGNTLSFLPDQDTECFLMQGECNANEDYADLTNDNPETSDLSGLAWISNVQSYTCWSPTN